MIDGLAAVEIDLHPVGEAVRGGVVPIAAVARIRAGALVVVDRQGRIPGAVGARCRSETTIAGKSDVGATRIRSPRFDFGDARPGIECVGDVDADPIGDVRREGDGALDEIVAADRAQRNPVGAIPALDREVDQAVETEGHRVRWLDWTQVVILHRIDHDMIDELRAIEIDLHPVREAVRGGVIPIAAGAGALVVVDRRNWIRWAIGARCRSDPAIARQGDVALSDSIDHLRQGGTGRAAVGCITRVHGNDTVRPRGEARRAADCRLAIGAAGR